MPKSRTIRVVGGAVGASVALGGAAVASEGSGEFGLMGQVQLSEVSTAVAVSAGPPLSIDIDDSFSSPFGGEDTDGDGLSDLDEGLLGTDPLKPDTDGDGLTDYQEVKSGTDPTNPDTDGDGLDDYQELAYWRTNPFREDTDHDGLTDGDEVHVYETDPRYADSDGDRLNDGDEINVYQTDPMVWDTDGDGFIDGDEVAFGGDPLDPNVVPDLPVTDSPHSSDTSVSVSVTSDSPDSADT